MTEELVTLETAKLLKEKGFNEYCKYVISDKGLMMETIFRTSKDLPKSFYSCPMQSIAQRWLRENKNLHVLSTPKVVESYNKIGEVVKTEVEFYYWDIYVVGSNKHKHIIQNCFTNQFNTYEEALEAGIQEALKLI